LFALRSGNVDSEIRRLALRVRLPLLLNLARAWHGSIQGTAQFDAGEWLAQRARALGVSEGPPSPLLKGRHLLSLGLPPGPALGPLLDQAFQLQLDGAFDTLDGALAWARSAIETGRGS